MRTDARRRLPLVQPAIASARRCFCRAVPSCASLASVKQDDTFESGRQAYEASDYAKAAQLLQEAAAKDPQNAEIQLLLAKTYYEMQQHDAAIASAEKAVALEPQNSVYHEWLGRTYGEKAEHAGHVFRYVAGQEDAQGIRDRRPSRREKFLRAPGADRIRLQRPGNRRRRRRQSAAANRQTRRTRRLRRPLRRRQLPASEKRFRRRRRRIHQSARQPPEIAPI